MNWEILKLLENKWAWVSINFDSLDLTNDDPINKSAFMMSTYMQALNRYL